MIIGYAEFLRCTVDGCGFTIPAPCPVAIPTGITADGTITFSPNYPELQRVETTLETHANQHTPIEFLTTIQRLQTDLNRAQAALREARDDHD